MNLAELQHYFARAATSGSGPLPELDRVFLGSERLSAKDRLAIYNRGYFYRLLDALASVFSQTKRLLGDPQFERLALAYLARHPSEHPAVERVGRSFFRLFAQRRSARRRRRFGGGVGEAVCLGRSQSQKRGYRARHRAEPVSRSAAPLRAIPALARARSSRAFCLCRPGSIA
ncbi:MAG: DNA-binding domain-containing protein [Pseudomonadota bacterium]